LTVRYLGRLVGTAVALLTLLYLAILDISLVSRLREIVLNGGSTALGSYLRGDDLSLARDELGGVSARIVRGHFFPLMLYVVVLVGTTVSIWFSVRGIHRFVHDLARRPGKGSRTPGNGV
jgi:hypothetical protein